MPNLYGGLNSASSSNLQTHNLIVVTPDADAGSRPGLTEFPECREVLAKAKRDCFSAPGIARESSGINNVTA